MEVPQNSEILKEGKQTLFTGRLLDVSLSS